MPEIQVNDVGTRIDITVKDQEGNVVDLTTSTDVKLKCLPPDGSSVKVFDVSFNSDGSDGQVYYITQDSDINTTGTWELQVIVTFGTNVFHSAVEKLKVLRNIGE